MSALSIIALDQAHLGDFNRCDGEFQINSCLRLYIRENRLEYEIVPHPIRLKRYPPEVLDARGFIDRPEQAIYLAYLEGSRAGQIILHTNWNGYGYVDEIVVDTAFRHRGVGRALIDRAGAWAKGRGLPGLMLETQDVNVAACCFYQSCGFTLSGFDRNLYRGQDPNSDEIALYWYLTF